MNIYPLKKIVLFLLCMNIFPLCFHAASAHASESTGLIEKWPDEKSGLMTFAENRLFFGNIREILVLDNDLKIMNSIPIKGHGEINDLHYSASTPGTVYAALGTGGIAIIDISDPDNRNRTDRIRGTADTGGFCTGIAVHNGTLFAANGNAGLSLIDITDPSSPIAKGEPFLPGAFSQVYTKKIAVSGNRIFMTDTLNGLWSVDAGASDFSSGFGILAFPGAYAVKPVPDSQMKLMLAGGEKIVKVDGTPSTPEAGPGVTLARPVDMDFSQGKLFAADSEKGIAHISLSGSEFNITGYTSESGVYAHSIAVSGNRLFAGDHRFGIRSFDIIDSQIPERFTGPSIRLSPYISGITAVNRGNIVYATVSDPSDPSGNGMLAFDTSTMLQPSVIARIPMQGEPGEIRIYDKTACVASGSAGLRLVDISDFDSFSEKSGITFSDRVDSLEISGSLAFLAAGSAGLRIVDVSDQTKPVEKGFLAPSEIMCTGIAVSGNTAYLADSSSSSSGIRIVDVTLPDKPEQVSVFEVNGRVMALAASGQYLYVGNRDTGLEIYDISKPSTPELKGRVSVYGGETTWRISVADNVLFAALGEKGMVAVDISDPANPGILEGWNYTQETVTDVWGKPGDPTFAYIASGRSGMRILGLDRSDENEEKPPFVPEPFGGGVKHGECFIRSVLW